MYMIVLVIHVLVSLFLIFIILIQSSKGEGLSDVFGGGSSQTTIFGSRAGNFLTKATTFSAVVFMITSLSLALLARQRAGSVVQQELIRKEIEEKVRQILPGEQHDPGAEVEGMESAPLWEEQAGEIPAEAPLVPQPVPAEE